MSDQQTTDIVVEGTKIAGSGGLGMVALAVIQRFFKKAEVDDEREAKALEAMVAEMKLTNASLANLTTKVDVLSERMSGVLARVDKNELKLEEAIERLSHLEGKFEHLQEQLVK
jgi:chromosome segregation ATPase